ncbi:regulatory protein RecX [Thermomonas sp.]|uniref:regulatory protein RecX n=1 Tax=Thermomonas sp. TaxID=1971895 RepID=UPI002487EF41|nr:regulatory protein RecX [Thermomonas sp.]MDI1253714.1 regulatory protein RecX [Thermomonas sp.]
MQPDKGDAAVSSSAPSRRRRPELSPTQRALGLLTRREHSKQELARKLTSRGVEPNDARAVIDKLANAGWQNDARFAELLVRSRANTGYGPVRMRAELATHALSAEIISSALEAFEGDWSDNARDLLRRRHPAALSGNRAAQRKAAEFLLRRGFGMDQVRAALQACPYERA